MSCSGNAWIDSSGPVIHTGWISTTVTDGGQIFFLYFQHASVGHSITAESKCHDHSTS